MNYSASMKQYLNDDIASKTSNLNPHKIIEEVLKDLKKNMETLAYSIDNEPVISSIKSQSFSKSLTAIETTEFFKFSFLETHLSIFLLEI